MPTPQSSRMNLDKARREGRVKFWRSHGESQRTKAEIVWLHQTKPELSQRVIARMFHVSQPYVQRVLKKVWLSGLDIGKAIGAEAYEHFRQCLERQRCEHFQAQVGAPASLTREFVRPAHEANPPFVAEPRQRAAIPAATAKAPATEYVELGRSTSGEIIELHGSKPPHTLPEDELQQFRSPRSAPVYAPQVTLSIRERVDLLASGFVYDQCPSFGKR